MKAINYFIATVLILPLSANASGAEKFNIDCKATKVELTGTDTWGENLYSKEREDAWLAEQTELAIDLGNKTYCIAKYCTAETYGAPEKIEKVQGNIFTLDIRPKKEYPSNENNIISSDYVFDKGKVTLTDHYKYYDEDGNKVIGNQKITYSCKKAPFKLYEGE